MKILSEEGFQKIIEAGYESRNLEFKPGFSWSDSDSLWLREKIIQTMLGMANTHDGGSIIVGINEKDNKPEFVGITAEQLATFKYDGIKGVVDSFASSSLSFDLAQATYKSKKYLVISVSDFDELPIICKNDGQYKSSGGEYLLRRGDVYTRSRSGPPATIRVTEVEMREIIDIAVDKSELKLKKRGWRYVEKLDEEAFLKQRKEFQI